MIIGGLLIFLGGTVLAVTALMGGTLAIGDLMVVGVPIVDGLIASILGGIALLSLFLV